MKIQIDQYDLLSFDIFDTLLLRGLASPSSIHQKVWEEVLRQDLYQSDLTPLEFTKLRVELELRARKKKNHREVTIEDIYQEIPSYIVKDINKLIQIEIEQEIKYCYPNFDLYQLIKDAYGAGKRIALVSDMYLRQEQIEAILKANGIDLIYFENILISCEHQCSKHSGELYEILLLRYPEISPDRILHIGDNKHSDVDQARKKGLDSYYYKVIPDRINSVYDYEKIRHNSPQKELLSLRKLAASSLDQSVDKECRSAYEIGASIIGPLMTLFISWTCDRMEKLGIHRIFPFMREGYLIGELLEREANHRQMDLYVKPIYVSRKVTYIASIEQINREEIENVIGARNLTILESIEMLGLTKENFMEYETYFHHYFKESHRIYINETTTLKESIIERFLENSNKEKIEAFVKQHRQRMVAYLRQNMEYFHEAATIDIGCFGRVQTWLEQALDLEEESHNLKHFLAIGTTGEKIWSGIKFEGYFSTIAEHMDLIQTIQRSPDVLEKLISVTEGSTIGYKEEGSQIVQIQSNHVESNQKYLDYVFQGVFNFQKYWFLFEKSKPELAKQAKANRRETLMILHRLIDMPRAEEAHLMGKFVADTNFGTNYQKNIITDKNKQLYEQKGADYIDKCNVSYTYENSNITWPKGLITLYDEFYYLRKALKSQSGNDILKQMQEVIESVVSQGIKEVALYGAGENGRQFFFICQLYNLKVSCFIDRKESIWGTLKEGIPIMGLDQAMARGYRNFVITSLFSIDEIRDTIQIKHEHSTYIPNIFSV